MLENCKQHKQFYKEEGKNCNNLHFRRRFNGKLFH